MCVGSVLGVPFAAVVRAVTRVHASAFVVAFPSAFLVTGAFAGGLLGGGDGTRVLSK